LRLFWILFYTITCVISGISLCFWLLQKAHEAGPTVWFLEHIGCPIIRIIILLMIDAINILFFGSLALSFVPILNHPVFTLPLQSCLSVALVFNWQYASMLGADSSLIPPLADWIKIIVYMTIAYFVTREVSVFVAKRIDRKMGVSGSIRLVADSIYLVLQIPVILTYCAFLSMLLASH
jgi:hypothetical protein